LSPISPPRIARSTATFLVRGGVVQRFQPWWRSEKIDEGDRWTVGELAAEAPQLLPS
jgi:hypothetical protein